MKKIKSIFSLIMCFVLIFSIFQMSSLNSLAAYENTYSNTGNQRVDIVEVAKTQIGCTDKYKYNNPNGYDWCALFVVWCAREANISSSIIKSTGWACADDLGVSYYSRSSYTPQSGDLIFFDWSNNSTSWDHVGLVEYVSNGYVHTIEGNTGSPRSVKRKSYSLSYSEIRGYGVPAYKNAEKQIGYNIAQNYTTENGKFYDSNKITITITPTVDGRNAYDSEIKSIALKIKRPNGSVLTINYGTSKEQTFYFGSDYETGKYTFYAYVNTTHGSFTGEEGNGSLSVNLESPSLTSYYYDTNEVLYRRIKFSGLDTYLTVDSDGNAVSSKRINQSSSNQNQVWKLIKNSDNSYTIVSLENNQALDVSKGAYVQGNNVLTYTQQNSENQKWKLCKNGNEGWYIKPLKSNSAVLDVTGGASTDNTNIELWTYNGGASQKVEFLKPYRVEYSANGGTNAPSTQYKNYNEKIALSTTIPTRDGYEFLGWNTNFLSSSAKYTPGATYSANEDIKLFAVWRKNTYTLSYDANGGTGAPSDQTKTHGEPLTLSSQKPTRTGYTFKNWNTKSGGSGTTYLPGGSYTKDFHAILYAQWTPNTYKVSFNANGGSCSTTSKTVTYDSTYGTLPVPTKSGCSFDGWYTSLSGGTKVTSGTTVKITSTQTLYARWIPNTYTLSYNANGGSGAPSAQTDSNSYTVSSALPTRFGYEFLGWSKSSSATSASYFAGNMITLTSDTPLYAVWKAPQTISTGTNYSVNINTAGKCVYYKFTPSSSGTYIIESVGSVDSKAELYNLSGSLLGSDDDSGDGSNFKISYQLTAGTTYYIKAFAYSSKTGTYNFSVNKHEEVLKGDVNNDKVVDAGDAVLISRYDAGLITLPQAQLTAGDVNDDGVVDAGDAVIISRYDAGLINSI